MHYKICGGGIVIHIMSSHVLVNKLGHYVQLACRKIPEVIFKLIFISNMYILIFDYIQILYKDTALF